MQQVAQISRNQSIRARESSRENLRANKLRPLCNSTPLLTTSYIYHNRHNHDLTEENQRVCVARPLACTTGIYIHWRMPKFPNPTDRSSSIVLVDVGVPYQKTASISLKIRALLAPCRTYSSCASWSGTHEVYQYQTANPEGKQQVQESAVCGRAGVREGGSRRWKISAVCHVRSSM